MKATTTTIFLFLIIVMGIPGQNGTNTGADLNLVEEADALLERLYEGEHPFPDEYIRERMEQSEYEEVIALLELSLERADWDKANFGTALAYSSYITRPLSRAYLGNGNYEEAVALAEEFFQMHRGVFGSVHMIPMYVYSIGFWKSGRLEQAVDDTLAHGIRLPYNLVGGSDISDEEYDDWIEELVTQRVSQEEIRVFNSYWEHMQSVHERIISAVSVFTDPIEIESTGVQSVQILGLRPDRFYRRHYRRKETVLIRIEYEAVEDAVLRIDVNDRVSGSSNNLFETQPLRFDVSAGRSIQTFEIEFDPLPPLTRDTSNEKPLRIDVELLGGNETIRDYLELVDENYYGP